NNVDFNIRNYRNSDLEEIVRLIHYTAGYCYPKVYPVEVAEFFKEYHNRNYIAESAALGYTLVAETGNRIIGTGNLNREHMGGVYVHPEFQKIGIGRQIVELLILKAKEDNLKRILLDSTFIAKRLYDTLGFRTVRKTFQELKDNKRLDYFEMELLL
ncbi:MAG: GNAT family N-acetyltransferase, partial [Bacteroidales bacterium]|nr:GNAT family N-acetyltransferase [Bacteroidales bacterium]